jgi:hypothetical protein
MRRQARDAEDLDPHDDREVRDGIARLRHALRHVAEQRGTQLADDLAQDCGISQDKSQSKPGSSGTAPACWPNPKAAGDRCIIRKLIHRTSKTRRRVGSLPWLSARLSVTT